MTPRCAPDSNLVVNIHAGGRRSKKRMEKEMERRGRRDEEADKWN